MEESKELKSLRIFLSHRYESPQVNLYFFGLFKGHAEFHFEVDEGTRPTCVTRLERMIRDADAFVGIYPYPDITEYAPGLEQMKKATRYFRLEMDLAARSGKPALVFYDKRYGPLLNCPRSFHSQSFDVREALEGGSGSSRDRHLRCFKAFLEEVVAFTQYQSARMAEAPPASRVVFILPPENSGFTTAERDCVLAVLSKADCIVEDPRIPQLSLKLMDELKTADWVVTDIGPASLTTGIPAFLHGQFCPSIRLFCARDGDSSSAERHLYNTTEVGYFKDIVRWNDEITLRTELEKRLTLIKAPSTWIGNLKEAERYFRKAALRKEAVFLSYSGEDRIIAAEIGAALKMCFQNVFDYRDGKSIATGKPWIEEVFESLAGSRIGIPLLSGNFFKTKNCLHEAQQMVGRVDQSQMMMLPVKIGEEEIQLPEWMQSFQYARYSEYENAAALVHWLLECYDRQ